jgi:hypothetical protein
MMMESAFCAEFGTGVPSTPAAALEKILASSKMAAAASIS